MAEATHVVHSNANCVLSTYLSCNNLHENDNESDENVLAGEFY